MTHQQLENIEKHIAHLDSEKKRMDSELEEIISANKGVMIFRHESDHALGYYNQKYFLFAFFLGVEVEPIGFFDEDEKEFKADDYLYTTAIKMVENEHYDTIEEKRQETGFYEECRIDADYETRFNK